MPQRLTLTEPESGGRCCPPEPERFRAWPGAMAARGVVRFMAASFGGEGPVAMVRLWAAPFTT